jgi:cyclase
MGSGRYATPYGTTSDMSPIRLIPRLDIKGPNLIKGIHLEGLRVVGDPHAFAVRYYEQGADELLLMDIVASLYGRNNLLDIIERAVQSIFIPITVGGGIRSLEDARRVLRSGADKVAINTAAIANPSLITQMAEHFGAQCVVLSVEAKKTAPGKWEAYTNNGRERTGLDALHWAQQAVSLGAGEILVTSIDREGTRKGYETDLIRAISTSVSVPVIASGGMGTPQHLIEVVREGKADAVAMADILHYNRSSLQDIRSTAQAASISVRDVCPA